MKKELRNLFKIFREKKGIFFTSKRVDYLIPIDKGWDSFPEPIFSIRKSFFSGRIDLVDKLSHWINDSHGGSILVSGVRGSGKTAFVYYSISKSYTSNWLIQIDKFLSSKGYIPHGFEIIVKFILKLIYNFFRQFNQKVVVVVNAALIDKEINDQKNSKDGASVATNDQKNVYQNDKDIFLKHIIACLFDSIGITQKTKKEFRELYEYCIGKSREERSSTNQKQFNLFFNSKYKITFIILNLILLVFVGVEITNPIARIIVSLLLVIQIGTSIYGSHTKTVYDDLVVNKDNFNYLYLKLNQLLKFSSSRFVFVIDEIDKIDKPERIDALIRDLKNLFTISNGRFIFVSNEEYANYLLGIKSNITDPFQIPSTYFNWQIFLNSLLVEEITNFITDISKSGKKHTSEISDKKLKEFSYYLYCVSGGVFSKIKENIRDFIFYQKKKPYLNLSDELFDKDKKRYARLGKIFYKVVKSNKENLLSRQQINELRMQTLYAIFREIITSSSAIKNSISGLCLKYAERGYKALNVQEKQIVKNSVKDLISDINKFSKRSELLGIVIPENEDQEFGFSFSISQVDDNLDDIRDSRKELSTTELEYKKLIDEVEELISKYQKGFKLPTFDDTILLLGDSNLSLYKAAKSVSDAINIDKLSSPSDIQNRYQEMYLLKAVATNKLSMISYYLKKMTQGEIFNYSEDELSKKLKEKNIDEGIIHQLINNSMAFTKKKGQQFVIITLADNIRRSFLKRIRILQQPKNKIKIRVICISNKAVKSQLVNLGLDKRYIKSKRLLKDMSNLGQIIELIKEEIGFNITKEQPTPIIDIDKETVEK